MNAQDNNTLYFANINGRPIISNSASSLPDSSYIFVEESNDLWKHIKETASSEYNPKQTSDSGKFVTKVEFTDGHLKYYECQGVEYKKNNSGNGGYLLCDQYMMNSSDERRKTDIKEPEFSGELPDIVQFRWKDTSALTYGVIAQDVEKAGLDTLVMTDGETGIKSVSYTELLLLYVKDLQERNKSLEERIKRLERLY